MHQNEQLKKSMYTKSFNKLYPIFSNLQEKYGFHKKIVIENNMLVAVSDLHLTDGTATNNLSPRAFKHFFNFIKRGIRENTDEIIIVLAGDTFDLLRTDYWMKVDDREKPWAMEDGYEDKKHGHLKKIFEKTLEVNSESLEILKDADRFFSPVPVKWVIILGNHDRLLGVISNLNKILSIISDNILIEKEGYENKAYGVTLRHGHEYDEYNYEPLLGIPIGDVNTVELFVRLPYEIKQEFPELEDELKSIEDIRPQWRMFDYLINTYREKDIKAYIEKTVDGVVDIFFNIPYVKHWIKHHDTVHPLDVTDKLRYALYLSKIISVNWAERFLKLFSYFEINEPKYEEMAATYNSLYTVFGHTHNEKISFLSTKDRLHRYYINTGTWRERIIASKTGTFSRYKSMTYAIFYKKGERDTEFPSFELWNGALRE